MIDLTGGSKYKTLLFERKNLKDLKHFVFDEEVFSFEFSFNFLTSLTNSPSKIRNDFLCLSNNLTDLIGGPDYVGSRYDIRNNLLTTLTGFPKFVGGNALFFDNFDLLDISDIWESKIDGFIGLEVGNIAILPAIKFNVYTCNIFWDKIFAKHKGVSKQNILDLQYDLIDHGRGKNARWKP